MFVTMSVVRLRQQKSYSLRSIEWIGILETTIQLIRIVCSMVISVTRVVKRGDSSYAQDVIYIGTSNDEFGDFFYAVFFYRNRNVAAFCIRFCKHFYISPL